MPNPHARPYDGQDRMRLVAPFAAGGVAAFSLTPLLRIERPLLLLAAGVMFVALLAALRWLPWERMPTWSHAIPACLGLVILGCGLCLSPEAVVFVPLTLGPSLFLALYGSRSQLAISIVVAAVVVVGTSLYMGRLDGGAVQIVPAVVIAAAASCLLFLVQHLIFNLRVDRERERALFDSLHEGVLYRDASGVRLANPAARRMLGITDEHLSGREPLGLTAIREDGSAWPSEEWPMEIALHTGEPQVDQLMGIERAGSTSWILVNARPVGGQRGGVIASFADVSAERRAKEALELQATTDDLTGLANRRRFLEHAEAALARSRRTRYPTAIVWIDLDGFKAVNDDLGHAVGDEVLREVAKRLEAETRPGDLLARYGGDEFALLMQDLDGGSEDRAQAAVQTVIDRLAGQFAEPVLGGRRLAVSASFGAGLFPRDGNELRALIDYADRDMYRHKSEPRELARAGEG